MILLPGAYATAKVFTDFVDEGAQRQIIQLCSQEFAKNAKVRIMPDVHIGSSCTIGFTANIGEMVIPNIVGVDIGCGVICVKLGKVDIDYYKLDEIIRNNVPFGKAVHEYPMYEFNRYKDLICFKNLNKTTRIKCSLGTLGGGNHFIEIDEDDDENKYLLIHTGSRSLGVMVAKHYQELAFRETRGYYELIDAQQNMIEKLRNQNKRKQIKSELIRMKKSFFAKNKDIPDELCYLTGKNRDDYLHDMGICQDFAFENRKAIANTILTNYFGKGIDEFEFFETVHNYIDLETNIVRKGAVSAKKGEIVLIPINMRDGSLICIGKGNKDWNCSAPHGAGRLVSRTSAMNRLDLEEYKNNMEGVFTTCINEFTLDESPMAYKDKKDILSHIAETVDVTMQIKSVYNFKAN